jgi:hypothetical protein
MPAQTSARSREDRAPRPARTDPSLLDLILAVGVALAVGLCLPHQPRTVDLRVSNPTDFDLTIDATDEHHDGWVTLGTIAARDTTQLDGVIDQGDTWVLRFDGQGRQGGQLTLDRTALDDASWRVQVPDRIGDRLRSQGAPPSPP